MYVHAHLIQMMNLFAEALYICSKVDTMHHLHKNSSQKHLFKLLFLEHTIKSPNDIADIHMHVVKSCITYPNDALLLLAT